jgi:hypothetical protein
MPHDTFPWLVILIIAWLLFLGLRMWFKQRQQEEAQKTVRLSIERGLPLTPELMNGLGIQPPSSDLKRGVVYWCIAIGVALFGLPTLQDGSQSSVMTFFGLALFPALIGTVLIVFHFIDRRKR